MTVKTYAFDAYGTLFDVHSAILQNAGSIGTNAAAISDLWRTKQLEYTWTLANMNRYEDFWSLTEQALDFALSAFHMYDVKLRERLLNAYEELDAFDDVMAPLKAIRMAGHQILILSNATPAMIKSALGVNNMRGVFDGVVSVDDIRTYKPRPDVYNHLRKCAAAEGSDEVVLISSNRWDVAGACAAGLKTVWCNRTGRPDEYQYFPPTKTVTAFDEIPALSI